MITMAKSPEEMKASMIAGMKEKTGKSLDEWLAIVRASGFSKHKEIMTHLKGDHALTHGFANMVALQALQSDSHTAEDPGSLVEAQYAGTKAALKPIYNKLLTAIGKFGKDVEVSPKKAYVSLRRQKQFALVQPSTATRLDVGINRRASSHRPSRNREASTQWFHRVRLSSAADVDKELLGWLEAAYDASKPLPEELRIPVE